MSNDDETTDIAASQASHVVAASEQDVAPDSSIGLIGVDDEPLLDGSYLDSDEGKELYYLYSSMLNHRGWLDKEEQRDLLIKKPSDCNKHILNLFHQFHFDAPLHAIPLTNKDGTTNEQLDFPVIDFKCE